MDTPPEFRRQAEALLTAIERQGLPRPFFVEFMGSPKSGKSTCIDIASHFFRRLRFKVLAPTEGAAKRTPYYLKDDLAAYNTWSACYALNHVLEGLYHSDRYHIAMLDRGLFDALVWFELLSVRNEVTTQDRDSVHKFLLIEKWRSVIDLLFFFKADPATSMRRENLYKLITEPPGRAMNPDFLNALNGSYEEVLRRYGNSLPTLVRIDTSDDKNTTPEMTAFQVVQEVVKLVEARLS